MQAAVPHTTGTSRPFVVRRVEHLFNDEPRILGSTLSTVLLRTCIGLALFLAVRFALQPTKHSVAPIFIEASQNWWQSQSLYVKRQLDHFRYPPLFAVLFTPFALLGPAVGGTLWAWLSLGTFLLALHCFERDVMPGCRTPRARAVLYCIATLGALSGLFNGQSNALLAALVLLGGCALVRERWWTAAWCLAGAVAIKTTALPFLMLSCALWWRPLIGRSVVVLSIGFLVPFLTRAPAFVWQQYQDWIHHLRASSMDRWPGFRDAYTIWLVFRHNALSGAAGAPRMNVPLQSSAFAVLQLTAAGAALIWCRLLARPATAIIGNGWPLERTWPVLLTERWRVFLMLAIGATWLMLFGPATEHPTYVFLSPFLAWALVERHRWPGLRWLVWLSFVLIMTLGWRELTYRFWPAFPWLIAALPLGALAFAVWLLAVELELKRGRGQGESSIHFS